MSSPPPIMCPGTATSSTATCPPTASSSATCITTTSPSGSTAAKMRLSVDSLIFDADFELRWKSDFSLGEKVPSIVQWQSGWNGTGTGVGGEVCKGDRFFNPPRFQGVVEMRRFSYYCNPVRNRAVLFIKKLNQMECRLL